jgi:hypothetical protein
MRKRRTKAQREEVIAWLPVDSRFITPFLSFGHVHGVAKLFLVIEMTLAGAVVTGSLLLLLVRILPL